MPAIPHERSQTAELEEFCRSEHVRLVGLLTLHVGDVGTAEELAQDAFARVCEHWPRVSEMANRRAWLNRVALNLANSWFRRKGAERRARARHGPDLDVPREADSADAIAVREAVAALPCRQRMALVLRYYEDLSVAQTSEVMGCADGTVKALTHHAIRALRDHAGLLDLTIDLEEAAHVN